MAASDRDAALRRLAEHTRALFVRALTEAELWQGLVRLLGHSAGIEATVAIAAAPEMTMVQTAPLRRVMLVGHLPFATVAECEELARRVYIRPKVEITGSAIALPIRVEKACAAVLVTILEHPPDSQWTHALESLSRDCGAALERVRHRETLEWQVGHDPVTGLARLEHFQRALSDAIHRSPPDAELAVTVLDLDDFSRLNESLGRCAGDALLRLVADRLRDLSSEIPPVRMSADRFAIVTSAAGGEAQLLKAFTPPFEVDGNSIRVSVKAGTTTFPHDGNDELTLLTNAEAALRRAQRSGKAHVEYVREINATLAQRMSFEMRVRQAVDANEFLLYYQPKLDSTGTRLTGLEALLRWKDADSGFIAPDRFIPLLEETGLIIPVGRTVLQTAMRDYKTWRDAGHIVPRIAVNISAYQLADPSFPASVQEVLASQALSGDALEIEITESMLMSDIQQTISVLEMLRSLGTRVAIDDFGTGHSSLRYLARLPVDTLKIDRSFVSAMVQDRDNMTIVSTIVSLAHAFHLKTVAEGVETEAQASVLRAIGCDEFQGYFFGRPVPFAAVTPRLVSSAVQ